METEDEARLALKAHSKARGNTRRRWMAAAKRLAQNPA